MNHPARLSSVLAVVVGLALLPASSLAQSAQVTPTEDGSESMQTAATQSVVLERPADRRSLAVDDAELGRFAETDRPVRPVSMTTTTTFELDGRRSSSAPPPQMTTQRKVLYIVGGILVVGGAVAGIAALGGGGDGQQIPAPPPRP